MGNLTDISGLALYLYFLFAVCVLGLVLLKEMWAENRRRSQHMEETRAKIAALVEDGVYVLQIPQHVQVVQLGAPSGDGIHVKDMPGLELTVPGVYSEDSFRVKGRTESSQLLTKE
ncbi:hypothetical protein R1flu_023574 [Riccia fluitans]|uniref:Uncharacterized protein n=1 Tax=Riccia fluitans TaxID=41844 RepID=A0ABD1XSE5_9MARC